MHKCRFCQRTSVLKNYDYHPIGEFLRNFWYGSVVHPYPQSNRGSAKVAQSRQCEGGNAKISSRPLTTQTLMHPSKSYSIILLGAAVILLMTRIELSAQTPSASSSNAAPNIIFILADDQSWNGTSVQMHPNIPGSKSDFYRTLNLEKLAAQGMRFSQAYSPGPMCSPTRASLQTGKSPAQLGMTNVGGGRQRPVSQSQKLILPQYSSTLPIKEVTIGEMLQRAGYATAWFGKWHLGGDGPAAHGYDESDGPTGNTDGVTKDPLNPKDIFGITRRGIDFMERSVNEKRPFYLQLWHYAVHGPVQTRPETARVYQSKPAGRVHQAIPFAGMTENLDEGVGMIMKKIKELGISDNTYIVYMSDHGAGRNLSSNAPLNQGKGTLWEGGMRVPMIVSGPGVKSGGFCDLPTVGWDLFPTFCELAGIKGGLPSGLEGMSLKSLFETGTADSNTMARQLAFHYPHDGQAGPHSTITQGGFKLIKFYETDTSKLFDLNLDIGEQNDLSQQQPEKAQRMHLALMNYLAQVNAGMPVTNPNFDPTIAAQARGPAQPRGPGQRPAGRGGPGAQRGSGAQRGPGGRGGRPGPSPALIAERKKEMDVLQRALQQKDLKTVGQLIDQMNQALANAPARRRRPGNNGGVSPRQQRQQELQKLDEAFKKGDTQKLDELISEIKRRLNQASSQAAATTGPAK